MYDFSNVSENKGFLRQPGLHKKAKLVSLSYVYNESWEAFDIELLTAEGQTFRERTFGANIDRVYPKQKYSAGKPVGVETKEEAFKRVSEEIAKKLYYLATCYISPEEVTSKKFDSLKEMITFLSSELEGKKDKEISFLTVWKNSDVKAKSTLIIADKIKWCEPYEEGKAPTIHLSKYQLDNQLVEKYPYTPPASASDVTETVDQAALANDLPF